MDTMGFIDLTVTTTLTLLAFGFVGGLVSGFIGSGGAFVLTPAMMGLGVPGIVAVASNMAHKFPKALVAAIKRGRYGQLDVKLGLVMGLFAELGVFAGKEVMTNVRDAFGDIGTNLYVSAIFVVVLAIIGGLVLRDAWRGRRQDSESDQQRIPRLARWTQSITIPGTMVYFPSIGTRVSLLFIAPLGFATGMLAASIAVGGFIGVPAMIYVLGVPAIMATATELVVAFVMGFGGTVLYSWDGFVDIRLSMIILAGSLFGVQIGAISTTYVKQHTVKFVMATIMIVVLISRLIKIPVYLSDLRLIDPIAETTSTTLSNVSFDFLVAALLFGGGAILIALAIGILDRKKRQRPLYDDIAVYD